jgi:hypothetical protein
MFYTHRLAFGLAEARVLMLADAHFSRTTFQLTKEQPTA